MNNPDHISESLETIFWVKILKFFDADLESEMGEISRIRNTEDNDYENQCKWRNADPQHCFLSSGVRSWTSI
jgi:hypothetical protein